MGIIELVGRGLGCESCGIVSASPAISFRVQILLRHHMIRLESLIS